MLTTTSALKSRRLLNAGAVRQLAAAIQGEVILPRDARYDSARAIWNGMIDRYPAIIVRVAGTTDVKAALAFAQTHELPVAVRGGGHNVAGHASVDNGIVIDMSLMNDVRIDAKQRLAYVSGGATWGDVDGASQQVGLAAPGGVVSKTGVAGLTLGGGFGWLSARYGMACDNLLAAEVVLADGRVITASADENADLLWGLRGGGGNFGIVTHFTFRLHPVGPQVMQVFTLKDAAGDRMVEAIRFFRDFAENAPDAVSVLAAIGQIPPHEEHYPVEIHGRPFVLFGAVYAGPAAEGQRVLQPLLDYGTTLVDASAVRPFVEAQQMFDAEYPDGIRYYWKSINVLRLTDEVIERIAERAVLQPSPLSTIDLWHLGTAVSHGNSETRAFVGQPGWLLNPEANWTDPADDEANIAWARDLVAAMQPYSDGGRYLNFAGFQEEGDAMMRDAYGANYARLAELKAKYDPQNLFRMNQNVKPAARPGSA